jgi:uncharacterized protein
MVHAYALCGHYLALDADTGALHLLDELAYEVICRFETQSRQQIAAQLGARFDPAQVEACYDEVAQLKAQGQLFTEIDMSAEAPSGEPGPIKAMCLHVAHDCQLRCRYCFAGTGSFHGTREFMSAQVGKKALDFLIAHSQNRKYLEVDFFGGEPLMNLDVVKELVAYGRELEKKTGKIFRFTITTNAMELDEETMDYFNREMFNVVLSVDGRKEVHDAMRPTETGAGSYDTAVANSLKMAKKRGEKSYYARGTFTAKNLDFSKDVLHLADLGFEQISVEPVVLPASSPLALKKEHLPVILNEYETLLKEYLKRRADGRWFNFFHFYVDVTGGPCVRRRLSGCGAGCEYAAVTPKGDLYPCHQFVGREGYRMGSVLTGEMDEQMRRHFAQNHAFAKPVCQGCWAKYFCAGGCAANAQAHSGDIFTPNDFECTLIKKRLECALLVAALEKAAQAE